MSDVIERLKVVYQKMELLVGAETTKTWMTTPNEFFSGRSPVDVVLNGQGQAVIEAINERLAEARE